MCDEISDFLAADDVPGMIFYAWGGGYAALNGTAYECDGKPVMTGRWSLWGDGTGPYTYGVPAMIENLLGVGNLTDPREAESYSFIPVLAWDHSYADVVTIVEALEADGRFDVVLPSQMLQKFAQSKEAKFNFPE